MTVYSFIPWMTLSFAFICPSHYQVIVASNEKNLRSDSLFQTADFSWQADLIHNRFIGYENNSIVEPGKRLTH